MTPNRCVEMAPYKHGTGGFVQPHITYISRPAASRTNLVPERLAPEAARSIQHNLAHGFGMRREESAPRLVVAPAGGGYALPGPEAQPPIHFGFSDPNALLASVLREHHDVRHARHDTPYRASLADQISDAAGCAFSMAGILLAAVVTWLAIFALFALVTQ